MFARISRYEGGSPQAVDEGLRVKKNVLPTAPGQTEGMKGAIFLADRSSGTILAITLWESEEAMKASDEIASRLRDEVTTGGETASVERYEVDLFAVEQA